MGPIARFTALLSLCMLSLVAVADNQPAAPAPPPTGVVSKTLEEQINPQITALLVIDMQNDYVADNGKLGKAGFDVKAIQAAVPAMNNLIMEARKAGVMVVWIRSTHTFKDSLPNYVAGNVTRVKDRPFAETDFLVQGGSWGAEYYEKYYEKMTKRIAHAPPERDDGSVSIMESPFLLGDPPLTRKEVPFINRKEVRMVGSPTSRLLVQKIGEIKVAVLNHATDLDAKMAQSRSGTPQSRANSPVVDIWMKNGR